MNDGTEHEAAVRALCAADCSLQRKGFRKAVFRRWTFTDDDKRLRKPGHWDSPKDRPIPRHEMVDELHLMPDAWKIVGDELHCYEITHTAIMTKPRRRAYALLWFFLDVYYVRLRLFVAGTIGSPGEVVLIEWYGKYVLDEWIEQERARVPIGA